MIPIVGTAVGGVVGGLIGAFAGGSAATVVSKAILDGLIEDDAKEMIQILPDCLQPLAFDYLLSEDEVKGFAEVLKDRINPEFLRDMYQSSDRRRFVYTSLESACSKIIAKRPHICLPTIDAVEAILRLKEEEVVAAME
jgi:hypothetical protein